MKLELLKSNSPLKNDSFDRKILEKQITKIESTANSLYDNIKLVEQEFVGCIIQVHYFIIIIIQYFLSLRDKILVSTLT